MVVPLLLAGQARSAGEAAMGFVWQHAGAPVQVVESAASREQTHVRVGLRNRAGERVTAVTVRLRRSAPDAPDASATVRLAVSVAPGETVRVVLAPPALARRESDGEAGVELSVVAVTFADGAVWRAPHADVPQPAIRPLRCTPVPGSVGAGAQVCDEVQAR
jgi:hypothetical protein